MRDERRKAGDGRLETGDWGLKVQGDAAPTRLWPLLFVICHLSFGIYPLASNLYPLTLSGLGFPTLPQTSLTGMSVRKTEETPPPGFLTLFGQ